MLTLRQPPNIIRMRTQLDIDIDFAKILMLLSNKLESWISLSVKMIPNVFAALVLVGFFWVFARTARYGAGKILTRFSENVVVNGLISTFVYLMVLTSGLFIALGILNLDKTVTSLLAGAGVIGLALGFAFQEIASNFISGILIAFRKPYGVGDVVSVEQYDGVVTRINLRTTIITTFQGLEAIIPNKDMFTKPLLNHTSTPFRRIDIEVGVSYGEDLEQVEEVTKKALEDIKLRVPSRPVGVFFEKYDSSSINLSAQVWVKYTDHMHFMESRHEAIIAIKKAYNSAGITIPFPIRTLDFGIKGGVELSKQLN